MKKKPHTADLARSGIVSRSALTAFGATLLSPEQTFKLTKIRGGSVPSYTIPYFDAAGKKTDFYRVRLLEPARMGFGAVFKLRYWQPPKLLPRFYLAKNVPWAKITVNPSIPLYITEGEKKAFCACLHKLPTIGLGGVWNWTARKKGKAYIDDFKAFDWQGRDVFIVFDNDTHTNPDVARALDALCEQLTKLGAAPSVTQLPTSDEKMGLDDYLVRFGPDAFKELKPAAYEPAKELYALNDELAYCEKESAVVRLSDNRPFRSRSSLVDVAYANRNHFEMKGDKLVEVNTAERWLRWPHRRCHSAMVYAPGEARITDANAINTWLGWGCEPSPGPIAPFTELMEYMFPDEEFRRWVWQWLAYPIRHPGTKLYTALVTQSSHTGTGKTLLGEIVGSIYGDNFSWIDHNDLHGNYNSWAAAKQFVMGDEVSGSEKRSEADRLKHILTRTSIRVSEKWEAAYVLADCANYYFTTNHMNAFYLDEHDRRFAIWSVESPPQPRKFYDGIKRWWKKQDGAAHLLHHFAHEVDLEGFSPTAPAPATEAKADFQEWSQSDLDLYIKEMLHVNPQRYLYDSTTHTTLETQLLTTSEIVDILKRVHPRANWSPIWVGRTMAKHTRRFRVSVRHGSKVTTLYLYVVQNFKHWEKATVKDARAYYQSIQAAQPPTPRESSVAHIADYRARRKPRQKGKW